MVERRDPTDYAESENLAKNIGEITRKFLGMHLLRFVIGDR